MNKSIYKLIKNNILFLILSVLGAIFLTQFTVNGLNIVSKAVDCVAENKFFDFKYGILNIVIYMILAVICSYVKVYSGNIFSIKIMKSIREIIIKKLAYFEYSFYDDNEAGKIAIGLLADIKELKKLLTDIIPQILTSCVSIVIILVYIFTLNRLLPLAVIISYPFVFLGVKLISKKILKLSKERRKLVDKESMQVYDIIGGIDIVKSYNLYERMTERVKKAMLDIFCVEKRRARITSVMEAVRMLLKWIPSIICICFGAILDLNGRLTTGELMAFVLVTERLFEQLSSLPYYINESMDAVVAVERLNSIINSPEERKCGVTDLNDSEYAVEFEDVCFEYDINKNVLNNINLKIKKGQKAAIVGSSGSGKSTIFKILCGFYNPKKGIYRFFGTDFNNINIEYARSKIALISQHIFLFPGTIRENIAYGNKNAGNEDIEKVCRLANIHDFIMTLPKGYDTEVGDRGIKLSGGERQRISLARAFLKDAEIILMDEPTSALDRENERLLSEALNNMKNSVTIIIIAHRLTTIENCDNIFVLDKGEVVEEGSHSSLIVLNGTYKNLYDKMNGEEIL